MDRNKVFDFIDDLASQNDAASVMDAAGLLLKQHGIDHFVFSFVPTVNQSFADVMLGNRLPEGWMEAYNEKKFAADDPGFRYSKTTVRPFRWLKEAPFDPEREPRAVELLRLNRDFGLEDGVVVPVISPGGRLGQVWFGGREFDLPVEQLRELPFMATSAFDRVLRLSGVPDVPPQILTAREREVLTLAASGLTDDAIAVQLHISKRTATQHIVHCREKLGAATRTHAVMIAMRDRIIEP
jgi:LuxR family quorum sensing-dependent transcriptional regulator